MLIRFSLPGHLARYVVEKGFIAVDGVSLTVVECDEASFLVSVVEYTLQNTNLGHRAPGDPVNLEVDILAKYVEKLLSGAIRAGGFRVAILAINRRGGRTMALATIEEAIQDFREGKPVILVDDEDRENEGDLIIAAEKVTPEAVNFMVTHGRGLVCMPLTAQRLQELGLPMMVRDNTSRFSTAFTVSVDAARGTTTGVSAYDRAVTIKAIMDPATTPEDLARPGHLFPLRYQEGGVLVRAGQTEGSIDLAMLAGLYPAAVLCEIMNEDGTMARMPALEKFAEAA